MGDYPRTLRALPGSILREGVGDGVGDVVSRVLRQSGEYQRIVAPLLQEIGETYDRFLLARASEDEVQSCFDHFRRRFQNLPAQERAAADPKLRAWIGIRPIKLEMDITTQCNLRCIMCYFADPRFSRRRRIDISVEDFSRIAEQIFGLCSSMSFSLGTEPLLHSRFAELLRIAAEYEIPSIYMNTNGLLLDERLSGDLVDLGLHQIGISIDAATRTTYERIRAGGRFERLLKNIATLQRVKERKGSRFPAITFNYVLMKSNIRELPRFIELAHRLGVEGVAAVHLTPFEGLGMQEESLETEPDLCNRMMDEARSLAERHEIPVALPESFGASGDGGEVLKAKTPIGIQLNEGPRHQSSRCRFPWHFVGIDSYGNVFPCGWWYTERPMGNIHQQSFDEIWNSEGFRTLRLEHETGRLRQICRNCPAAGMGSVDQSSSFRQVRLGDSPG